LHNLRINFLSFLPSIDNDPFCIEASVAVFKLEDEKGKDFLCYNDSFTLGTQSLPPVTEGAFKIDTHFLILLRLKETDFFHPQSKVWLLAKMPNFFLQVASS
jgi:hypothetical protein